MDVVAVVVVASPHPGLAASYRSGPDGAGLLVAAEDLGDAAVGDPQLPGDDAGPDPVVGHLHYLVSDVVGQRPAVDKDTSELVDPSLAQRSGHCGRHRVSRELSHSNISSEIWRKILPFEHEVSSACHLN